MTMMTMIIIIIKTTVMTATWQYRDRIQSRQKDDRTQSETCCRCRWERTRNNRQHNCNGNQQWHCYC